MRCAIKTVKGNVKEISYKHWQDLNLLIKKKKGSLVLNLPQLKIEKKYNKLIFSINKRDDFEQSLVSAKATSTLICSKKMKIPGITKLYRIGKEINSSFLERKEDFCLFSKFHQSKDWIEKNNKQVQFFDVDKLRFPLLVRSRLPGDRIQPFGMQSKKKVKEIFIEAKVPFVERRKIPLVISADEIIWICGFKRSEQTRVSKQTNRILKMEIKEKDAQRK